MKKLFLFIIIVLVFFIFFVFVGGILGGNLLVDLGVVNVSVGKCI